MRSVSKLLIFTLLVVLVNTTAWMVLRANQLAGVYPIDADTIIIPIAETLILSVVGAVLLLSITIVPRILHLLRRRDAPKFWRVGTGAAVILAYVLSILLFVPWAISWLIPMHYLIAASLGLVVAAILFFAFLDYRGFRKSG